MNQLRLEESVRQVLAKCRERGNSGMTRELIHSLLNNNAQESLDVLSILVRELWVLVLHNESDLTTADSAQSTPNVKRVGSKESLSEKKPSPKIEVKPFIELKPSQLGTIPLSENTEFDGYNQEASASDVPSHSSASSEDDEETEDKYAEELWKQTLSTQEPNFQTHKDFFATLVKDVEGKHQSLNPKGQTDEFESFGDDLALDERIFVAISSSVALAEQTQRERDLEDGEDDDIVIISSTMISDIAMNTAQQMSLDGIQAVRCAEDIEDCLCFLFGQPLDSNNKNYLIHTIQKLMLDRGENLVIGMWYDPAEEDDGTETFDGVDQMTEQLEVGESLSTPDKAIDRSKLYQDTKSAEDMVRSESKSNLVHQTPARTPHNMITPGKSTASKRQKINYEQLDPELPAWMIPKSPLDSIFRTGYGGIGQSQLKEVIALVEEDSEEEESDGNEHVDHMRLHHTSMDQISLADDSSRDAIEVDDLPKNFGNDRLLHHHGSIIPRNSMTKSNSELLGGNEDIPDPQDHPSTSFQYEQGKLKLTKSALLNAMIVDSYKGLMSQYASHSKGSHNIPVVHHQEGKHYDYDEATVGTSMDSEGYKRMLKQAKRAASPSKSSSSSPKKKSPSPLPSPKPHTNDVKTKKPVVVALVKSKQRVDSSDADHGYGEESGEVNLMLESPATSISVPKRSKKDPKVTTKKKRASTGSHSVNQSAGTIPRGSSSQPDVTEEIKKKKTSSTKKLSRATSGSRLLEPTEAMKSRVDAKTLSANNLGGRWKT